MANPFPEHAAPRGRRAGCPVCDKPPVAAHGPFCSQGCRDRDLLQWLGEGYRVPGTALDSDPEE